MFSRQTSSGRGWYRLPWASRTASSSCSRSNVPSGRSCSAWECTPATCARGAELGGSGPALPVPSVPASSTSPGLRLGPCRPGPGRSLPCGPGSQRRAAASRRARWSRAGAGARHLPAPPRRARRRAGAPRRPGAAEPPCAGSGTSLRHRGAVRELHGRGQAPSRAAQLGVPAALRLWCSAGLRCRPRHRSAAGHRLRDGGTTLGECWSCSERGAGPRGACMPWQEAGEQGEDGEQLGGPCSPSLPRARTWPELERSPPSLQHTAEPCSRAGQENELGKG